MTLRELRYLKDRCKDIGPNAFSGAINIITISHEKDNVRVSLEGGEHDYYDEAASVTFNSGKMNNNISIDQSASNRLH